MAELADAFVALPGGLGALEGSSRSTWAQLGLHRKACGLLDVEGYYSGAAPVFLDHAVAERFVRTKSTARY